MGDIKFDTTTYTFDDLATKYRDFYSPAFKVFVGGTDVLQADTLAISDVVVETSNDAADSVTFRITNTFDLVSRKFASIDQFKLGADLEIQMGYVDKLVTVFQGLITKVERSFPEEEQDSFEIIVTGMDLSFLMMRGKHSQTWTDKKISDVVKEIGGKYASTVKVTDTAVQKDKIVQYKTDDYRFLSNLAREINYDFFVVGKTIYFQKKPDSPSPVIELEWGKNIINFNWNSNLASQVSKVTVRGWNEVDQAVVLGESSSVSGSIPSGGVDVIKTMKNKREVVVYAPVTTEEEAKNIAEGTFNKFAEEHIYGTCTCVGIPEIRAGRYLKVKNVDDKVAKSALLLRSVKHEVGESGYLTTMEFGKKSGGALEGYGDESVHGADGDESAKCPGVMTAIVTDNQDPEGLGRIKVQYKLLEGEEESAWVRIATLMAGKDRGTLFIPEVGDEVLVAFHLGHMRRPYVIGALWSKPATPLKPDDKNNIRKIKSRAGHELIFDDTKDAEKFQIKTNKGHNILIDDKESTITITEESKKNFIEIKGGSSGELTIKSSSDGAAATIILNSKGEVQVQAGKSVSIKAPQIAIEASGTLDIKSSGALNIKSDAVVKIEGSLVKIN